MFDDFLVYETMGPAEWARRNIKFIPDNHYVGGIWVGWGGTSFPHHVKKVRCGYCRIWGHNQYRCPIKWLHKKGGRDEDS